MPYADPEDMKAAHRRWYARKRVDPEWYAQHLARNRASYFRKREEWGTAQAHRMMAEMRRELGLEPELPVSQYWSGRMPELIRGENW